MVDKIRNYLRLRKQKKMAKKLRKKLEEVRKKAITMYRNTIPSGTYFVFDEEIEKHIPRID